MDLMPIIPEKSPKLKKLIVCPSNWDGIACSVILSRLFDDVDYQLFGNENNILEILRYPALLESETPRELIIAGFVLPREQANQAIELLSKSPINQVTWYSHHFWSDSVVAGLKNAGVRLSYSTEYSSTSEFLIHLLKINDPTSTGLATQIAQGASVKGPFYDWFLAVSAIKDEPYQIRHLIEPLYKGENFSPSPAFVEQGRELIDTITETIDSSYYFREEVGSEKLAVVGLPASYRGHYKAVVEIAAEKLQAQFLCIFFDGTTQIILHRGISSKLPIDFLDILSGLESRLTTPAMIYDKSTLVFERMDDIKKGVENLVTALRNTLENK